MVFLSMLHHFNYPELKYYIYSHFSFHLNLLAVCNCNSLFYIDSSVITQAIFSYYDTFTFVSNILVTLYNKVRNTWVVTEGPK